MASKKPNGRKNLSFWVIFPQNRAFFTIFRAMRTLIVLLLLSCLCLASRAKTKLIPEGSVITVQPARASIKAAAHFKRTKSALRQETIASESDLIYQNITSFSLVAVVFFRNQYHFFILPQSTPRILRDKRNYSYYFTWNCLYPKHTFW